MFQFFQNGAFCDLYNPLKVRRIPKREVEKESTITASAVAKQECTVGGKHRDTKVVASVLCPGLIPPRNMSISRNISISTLK